MIDAPREPPAHTAPGVGVQQRRQGDKCDWQADVGVHLGDVMAAFPRFVQADLGQLTVGKRARRAGIAALFADRPGTGRPLLRRRLPATGGWIFFAPSSPPS